MDCRLYAVVKDSNVHALEKYRRHKFVGSGDTAPLQTKPDHDRGIDIFQEITAGRNTVLHLAAHYGHLRIVKVLLKWINEDRERGKEGSHQFIVAQNSQGNTALHEAVKGGNCEIVTVLLQQSRELVNLVNNAGETALFKAAEEGYKDIVVELMPLTSPIYDKSERSGHTPLHTAVSHRHKDVIEYMLDQRVDLLRKTDTFGRTPLHSVAYVKRGVSEIAKLLLKKNPSLCYEVDVNHQTAFHIAVIEGNVELVEEILNCRQDCFEIVDKDGRNAFHLAAENADQISKKESRRLKNLVAQLLICKEHINDRDNHGKTALDIVLQKMRNDERLFGGMKSLLQVNGARITPDMVDEEALDWSSGTEYSVQKSQIDLVNVVMIATVAVAMWIWFALSKTYI